MEIASAHLKRLQKYPNVSRVKYYLYDRDKLDNGRSMKMPF
mgnify:FL=1